jgi:alanine racemase
LEIDTGMGRTGVLSPRALEFVRTVSSLGGLEVEGIFSHFAVAEADPEYTGRQFAEFCSLLDLLERSEIRIPLRHCANSAAILAHPESYLNMVRPGLVIYGLYPSSESKALDISPIMSFKARIVHVQRLPRGSSISYGRTFTTQKDMTIATISVGYGDGYSRSLSNRGEAIIRGRKTKVVGTVCMDLTMVDCTGMDDVQLGDECTLIGQDGSAEITADDIARLTGTISYEVTSSIGPRVPRVFLKDGLPSRIKSLLGNEDCLLHSRHD